MTGAVTLTRFVAWPLVAALLAASGTWMAMGAFRPIIWQSFVVSLLYATPINACALVLEPWATRHVAPRGPTRTVRLAAAFAIAAVAGSLVGGGLLRSLRLAASFWPTYWFMCRIAVVLAVGVGLVSHAYHRLTADLEDAQRQLLAQEVARAEAQRQALEARLASLEARIHPHFLFNTLNSLSALIPVDPERAETLLMRLSALLRSSLRLTEHHTIPLGDELDLVRSFVGIEQERLGSRLEVSCDLPSASPDGVVPPFLLQSLVENAIKHGIGHLESGGRLELSATREASHWHVEVRDNGPGFDLVDVPAGHGLDLAITRLDASFGAAASLTVDRRRGWCVVGVSLPVAREADHA
ncbi:MAG TPA: histidine kinase [Vicinamibacterales bacterium]